MSRTNAERVGHAFEALGGGDMAPLIELLATDVVYTLIGDTVVSGVYVGRDRAVTEVFGPLGQALAEPLRFDIQRLLSDGPHVVMQARGATRLRSGAPYRNTYCMVFRFEGDRVRELTEYLDTALVTRAVSVPVERDALLRQMDLNMWEMFRDIIRHTRGGEIVEGDGYWMGFSPRGTPFHNALMVRGPLALEPLLAAAAGFFGARRVPFSVWTRAHADAELEAALRAHGFSDFIAMPAMALLGDPGIGAPPDGLTIRAARDDQGRRDYLHVTAEAYATYGAPRGHAVDAFAALESVCAPHIQGFVGYAHDTPVAAAAVYVTHGVAGIGWVGTVPDQRGRGFAEAVTWAAVREGFRRGAAFANLQASPMGRPVYARMGFITPTEYRVLVPG